MTSEPVSTVPNGCTYQLLDGLWTCVYISRQKRRSMYISYRGRYSQMSEEHSKKYAREASKIPRQGKEACRASLSRPERHADSGELSRLTTWRGPLRATFAGKCRVQRLCQEDTAITESLLLRASWYEEK